MGLAKRYCVEEVDGTIECFANGGFWYTQKGQIVKWSILGSLFGLFMLWFIGGYIHARRRLKAGKPLLAYHRLLVSWQERKRYGQTEPPQNHFTFYESQNPYQNRPGYQQRADGSWPEAPPTYNGTDAPPQYFAPPGASKTSPNQSQSQSQNQNQNQNPNPSGGQPMEMPPYGAPVVAGNQGDVEQGGNGEQLPPRPPQKAKAVLKGFTDRFRK